MILYYSGSLLSNWILESTTFYFTYFYWLLNFKSFKDSNNLLQLNKQMDRFSQLKEIMPFITLSLFAKQFVPLLILLLVAVMKNSCLDVKIWFELKITNSIWLKFTLYSLWRHSASLYFINCLWVWQSMEINKWDCMVNIFPTNFQCTCWGA